MRMSLLPLPVCARPAVRALVFATSWSMPPSSLGKDVFADAAMRDLTAYDDLVANVQACMDAGEIPAGDADLAARVVWAQVHGLAALLIAMPEVADGPGRNHLVERMMRAINTSLLAG
jgi:hypothetical protein